MAKFKNISAMKNEITPEGALDILENANIAISLVQARAKIKRRQD